jgi:hypothetical protein
LVCLRSFDIIGTNNSFFVVPLLVEVRIYWFFFASIQKNIVLKRPEVAFLKLMEPRNRFQGVDSASLCSGGPEPIFVDV